MVMVDAKEISYSYLAGNRKNALESITLQIRQGEFVALLGSNGSGKSTLARHLNVLLQPQQGSLYVNGMDARQRSNVWKIRRCCGMVFQNPDNQFVSSIVEEDIAFGLENYEIPQEEIPDRISEALRAVGMPCSGKLSPHMLSGGQKQRIALAGVLALRPELLVFDEVTAMLDPGGKTEVSAIIDELHRQGRTIVLITHEIEEAITADRIVLLNAGRILAQGKPEDILTDRELLTQAALQPPMAVRLYYDLKDHGLQLDQCPLTNEDLVDALCQSH